MTHDEAFATRLVDLGASFDVASGAGADWLLARRFGCDPLLAGRLALEAAEHGLGVGLSFHVGSQQRDVTAWDRALAPVAACFAMLGARTEVVLVGKRSARDGSPTGPVAVAGPTCDSADVLSENYAYELPLDLDAGDLIDVHSAGAYTPTYSTVGFNGFRPLDAYYLPHLTNTWHEAA